MPKFSQDTLHHSRISRNNIHLSNSLPYSCYTQISHHLQTQPKKTSSLLEVFFSTDLTNTIKYIFCITDCFLLVSHKWGLLELHIPGKVSPHKRQ